MKRILKNIYLHCGFITRLLFGGIGHILVLHRVCPPGRKERLPANAGMEITPGQLETLIQFFASGKYDFISLDQLADRLQNKTGKRKFVIFTFDDGYTDNLIHAYPVFKKHNVPFTIYVTTGFPDRHAIMWWYLLEDLLLEKDRISIKAGDYQQEFNCRSLSEKQEAFLAIRSAVMNLSADNYEETIKEMFEPYGLDLYRETSESGLSWGQIKQLSQDPLVTIGAHTVNHYALSKLSLGQARNEILKSKQIIESHLKKEIKHFAYPFGGRDEAGQREFEMIKEIGFETGVTARFANIFPGHKYHLECLPRIFVSNEADADFFKQVINGTLTGMANKFKRVVTV